MDNRLPVWLLPGQVHEENRENDFHWSSIRTRFSTYQKAPTHNHGAFRAGKARSRLAGNTVPILRKGFIE